MKISQKVTRKLITLGLIVILSVIFAATTSSFLKLINIQEILRVAAYTGIICVGVSFVLISGGIDLSSGGIICFTGIICCRLAVLGLPWPVILLAAVVVGAACGFLNGWLITHFYLNDFITTLATGFVFSGFGLLTIAKEANGTVMSQTIRNRGFLMLGKHVGGFYYIVIAWIVLTLVAWFVQTRTRYGLHTCATGSNAKSSEMSGVNVKRMKISTFTICGACCAVGAAFTVAQQQTAVLAVPDGKTMLVAARCVVTKEATLRGVFGLNLEMPNDVANGFIRHYAGDGFRADLKMKLGKAEVVDSGSPYLNIDNCLTVRLLSGGDTLKIYRSGKRDIRIFRKPLYSMFVDRIVSTADTSVRRRMPGEVLFDTVFLISADVTVADSPKLTGKSISSISPRSRTAPTTTTPARPRILALNVARPPHMAMSGFPPL